MYLTIHLGTHKTGTTSLQKFCCNNVDALAKDGILFPLSGRSSKLHGHHNIAWQLIGDRRFNPTAGTIGDLITELKSSELPRALVSSEDFEYLSQRPGVLRHFCDRLATEGIDVAFVVVLRDLQQYAESLYTELTGHGIELSKAEFIAHVEQRRCFLMNEHWYFEFDHDRLINQWTAAVPALEWLNFDDATQAGGTVEMVLSSVGASNATIQRCRKAPRLNAS